MEGDPMKASAACAFPDTGGARKSICDRGQVAYPAAPPKAHTNRTSCIFPYTPVYVIDGIFPKKAISSTLKICGRNVGFLDFCVVQIYLILHPTAFPSRYPNEFEFCQQMIFADDGV